MAGQTINAVQGPPIMLASFDGDGKADLAVFRPSTGHWYVRQSVSNFGYSDFFDFGWGHQDDVPIAGDFDGDGKADVTAYRPSSGSWYVRLSSRNFDYNFETYQWGNPGDIPLVADFDGDRKSDLVVFRPSSGT